MERKSIKKAYVNAVTEAANYDERIVVLDADLGRSTMTIIFEQAHPERFFDMGIAEQNLAAVAAGFAVSGKRPFINSFSVFVTGRNYDQIRQCIALSNVPVVICGSSCGFSDFGDGSTHQSLEDISLMRTLPNMTVLVPCDEHQMKKMVTEVLKLDSPSFIRINRNEVPVMTSAGDPFKIGDLYTVVEGSDYAIIANGNMLHIAVEASKMLEKDGISVKVIDAPTVKPMNKKQLHEFVDEMKGIVVVDEHSKYGGLFSTIAEIMIEDARVPVRCVAVNDTFGISGEDYDSVLEHFGLTPRHVVEAVKSFKSK